MPLSVTYFTYTTCSSLFDESYSLSSDDFIDSDEAVSSFYSSLSAVEGTASGVSSAAEFSTTGVTSATASTDFTYSTIGLNY